MKIIIKNNTKISEIKVLSLVQEVIALGRISNNKKQYCHSTIFIIDSEKYYLITDLHKSFTDIFIFYKITQP